MTDSKRRRECKECSKLTTAHDFVTDEPLCPNCRELPQYTCVTKTRAMDEYECSEKQLDSLPFLERPNPHFRTAHPMKLYRLADVMKLADAAK